MATFADIIGQLNQLRGVRGAFESIAVGTHSNQLIRIFEKGRASNGGPIGQYKTNKLSIKRENAIRPFKKGSKSGMSATFAGGYKAFKADQGFNANIVNLKLKGDLEKSYNVRIKPKSIEYYFDDDLQANKAEWNEKNFAKKVFDLQEKELANFTNNLEEAIGEILDGQ